jgi:hypothetical protein
MKQVLLLQCTSVDDIHEVDVFDENTVEVQQMTFAVKAGSVPKGTVMGTRATEEFVSILDETYGVKLL